MKQRKGYIQIYTGNCKGKTTASLGLTLRALGAGFSVYYGQFMKDGECSAIKALTEKFPELEYASYGKTGFMRKGKPRMGDPEMAQEGLIEAKAALSTGKYDLVVLDELCVTLFMELVSLEDVLSLIDIRPAHTELVLTGRYAHPDLIERADLVTEMTEIKHYFTQGIPARLGIEK